MVNRTAPELRSVAAFQNTPSGALISVPFRDACRSPASTPSG